MRWPWAKHDAESTAGAEALTDAEKKLQEAVERWSDVRKEAGELQAHLERNHFADAIRSIMRGTRP